MAKTLAPDGIALLTNDRTGNNESILFVIPTTWAESKIEELFGMSIDEFLGFYTWDNTEYLFDLAQRDGILIK